jgi:hypothetical protein
LCYDSKDHRIVEEERCLGKIIKRNGERNVEPSIKTRNGVVPEACLNSKLLMNLLIKERHNPY